MAGLAIDVLVVGAGPAGCAAGTITARAGARVLVLDRASFPRPKTCGDAVSNRGARLGRREDALTSIPNAVVDAAAAILPDGARIGRSFGHEPGFIVPRLFLDDLLRGFLEGIGPTTPSARPAYSAKALAPVRARFSRSGRHSDCSVSPGSLGRGS